MTSKIVLAANPQVASVLAGNNRPPEEAFALVMLALLVLALGWASCNRAARRAGLSLREWLAHLR